MYIYSTTKASTIAYEIVRVTKFYLGSCTTGTGYFNECLRHLTKPKKHSANSLPSVTLNKEVSMNCTSVAASLPRIFCRVFDKVFAERRCTPSV
jgi:hypothetical protein